MQLIGYELDQEKSLMLFKISDEVKQIKVLAKQILRISRKNAPFEIYQNVKNQISSIQDGAALILKEARKMHFKAANQETVPQLETMLNFVISERKYLESSLKEAISLSGK